MTLTIIHEIDINAPITNPDDDITQGTNLADLAMKAAGAAATNHSSWFSEIDFLNSAIAAAVLICWFFPDRFLSAIAAICFFPLSKNFLEKEHLRTYLKNALNRTNLLINLVKWALEHFIHHIACSWLWLSVSFYALILSSCLFSCWLSFQDWISQATTCRPYFCSSLLCWIDICFTYMFWVPYLMH